MESVVRMKLRPRESPYSYTARDNPAGPTTPRPDGFADLHGMGDLGRYCDDLLIEVTVPRDYTAPTPRRSTWPAVHRMRRSSFHSPRRFKLHIINFAMDRAGRAMNAVCSV